MKFGLKLFITFYFSLCSCKIIENNTRENYYDCAINFVKTYLSDNILVVITGKSSDFDTFLTEIFTLQVPKIVYIFKNSDNKFINHPQQTKNYVFLENNFLSFQETSKTLRSFKNHDTRSKHFILFQENITKNDVENVFLCFMKTLDVFDVVVATRSKYYTWYPYAECGKRAVAKDIKFCTGFRKGLTPFGNKISKNLNLCPIKVRASS